jgi:hypothetical protein
MNILREVGNQFGVFGQIVLVAVLIALEGIIMWCRNDDMWP